MAIIKKGQEKINLTVTLTKKQTILMTRNKSKKASAIDNSNMVLHSFIQKLLRMSCITGNTAKTGYPFSDRNAAGGILSFAVHAANSAILSFAAHAAKSGVLSFAAHAAKSGVPFFRCACSKEQKTFLIPSV